MVNPIQNNTNPCNNPFEGSSSNARKSISAKGITDPELTFDIIIHPEFGILFERIYPILPPNKPPIEVATIKAVHKSVVVLCEKPISSNHRVAKAIDD